MNSSWNFSGAAVFAALLVLGCACGPAVGGTDGVTDGTGTHGTTDAEPTTGGHAAVDCVAEPGDHTAACPDAACPIVVDLEIRCDDSEFAAPGFRVAPAPDTTWLVTASSVDAMLFRAAAEGIERVEGVLDHLERRQFIMGASPEGIPHVVALTTWPKPPSGGVEYFTVKDGVWSGEQIVDFDHAGHVIDVQVAPDGRPHVFFVSDPPLGHSVTVPDGDAWTTEPAPGPADAGGWSRFVLTPDGRRVAMDYVGDAPWQLVARVDGQGLALGDPVGDEFPLHFVPAAGTGVAPGGPDVAAAIQHPDGLRVAWLTGGGYEEVAVTGTEAPQATCLPDGDGVCTSMCTENAVGVEEEAFSFTRTADGVGWLAWLVTRFAVTTEEVEVCDPEFGCNCAQEVVEDLTTSELRLARVPLDGSAPTEVLTLPLPRPARSDLFLSDGSPVHIIEATASGSDLAIAVRVEDPKAFLRLLRIDTTSAR